MSTPSFEHNRGPRAHHVPPRQGPPWLVSRSGITVLLRIPSFFARYLACVRTPGGCSGHRLPLPSPWLCCGTAQVHQCSPPYQLVPHLMWSAWCPMAPSRGTRILRATPIARDTSSPRTRMWGGGERSDSEWGRTATEDRHIDARTHRPRESTPFVQPCRMFVATGTWTPW